jgi:hypothetical protein
MILSGLTVCAKQQSPLSSQELQARAVPQKPLTARISPQANIARVVVKFRDADQVRLRGGKLFSKSSAALGNAPAVLAPYLGSRLSRLFDNFSESKLDRDREVMQAKSGHALADLNGYYQIQVSSVSEAEQLINELNASDAVELAFVEPAPEPAGDIDPPTPNYQPFQDYRKAAPIGVDADYADSLAGGDGSGIKIIDIEGNWNTTHEDLDKASGGIIAGVPIDDSGWKNHGTAVLGEMIAGDNGYGVTGICPGADIGMVSIGSLSTAEALYTAVDNLQQGDVILIELHAPGPRYNFLARQDQLGYVCMEYWQDNFDAIQYAWAKGIVVVEAAGNGEENYDDPLYGQLFDTTYRNSHAIIVGAGYSASSASDLERLGFSDYGERVNLQGYGVDVYTTGYGTLFDGGGDENQYYTYGFNGTSSASPIIAGSVTCLQGYYKATYGVPTTSDYIRDVLVSTGTPQTGNTSEHIGPRPNLRAAMSNLAAPPALYASPVMLDTTVSDGQAATMDLWLVNRSNVNNAYFFVYDQDTLYAKLVNWLRSDTQSGSIPPGDSAHITVTLDASLLGQRVRSYKGALKIVWGNMAGQYNKIFYVPAYLTIPCDDSSYTVLSNNDVGGPVYNWISAKDLGTMVPQGSFYGGSPLDDGTAGPFSLGFSFPFYDSSYSSFYVGTNGAISFTDTTVNVNDFYSALSLPGAPFQTFVAPFWSDLIFDTVLVPDGSAYIYRSPAHDTTVIEWYRAANFNQFGDTLTDFEIVLTPNGNILCQYKNVGSSGLEQLALVGISQIECKAFQYVDGGDIPSRVVGNGSAVLFDLKNYRLVESGDVDNSGEIDIGDLVYMAEFSFSSGPPPQPRLEEGDVNCSGDVDIADIIYFVDYMFASGPPPCSYWIPID